MAQHLMPADHQEVLLLNQRSHVACGSMSNVFAVIDQVLHTPGLGEGAQDGRMRARILQWAGSHGITAEDGILTCEMAISADELFVSNSLIGVWPIRKLGHRTPGLGPMTRQIMTSLNHPIINRYFA